MRSLIASCIAFCCLLSVGLPQTASAQSTNLISLEECVRMAMEKNLRIQIARIDPGIARYQLSGSYGIYDPRFEASYVHEENSQEEDIVQGQTFRAFNREADSYRTGLAGELPLGLQYDMGFSTVRQQETTFPSFPLDPAAGTSDNYNSRVGIDLTQPLLRDFWTSDTRTQIQLNKRNLRISEEAYLQIVMTIVRDVEVAYYDLVAAQDQVKVQQKALELANKLYQENKRRVEAGVLAALDEKQAESEAATAQAALIASQAVVVKAENFLKNLISDNFEYWSPIRIMPTEKLLAVPQMFSKPDSWANALENRPDFNQLKYELEKQGLVVRLSHNQLFPSLNIVGSYGRSGIDAAFGGTIMDVEDETSPRHSYGVILSVPLSRRSERSSYRIARETERQLQLQLKELHQNIIVEVDSAIVDVQSAYDQIPARREAVQFAQQALDAEQKKLENGKSTSFFVLELQRNLTDARAAEIQALTEYNRAQAELYFREATILDRNKITVTFE